MRLVETPGDFWRLYDDLLDDRSDFVHNRVDLLAAYTDRRMFTLCAQEDDAILPCLCTTDPTDPEAAEILWVYGKARRRGLGRTLIRELKIVRAYVLEESVPFWTAVGFVEAPRPVGGRHMTFMTHMQKI